MFFPSKKDAWMGGIIWFSALFLIISPIFFPDIGVWMTPDFLDKQWIKVAILSSIGLFLLWIWFKTGYTIEEGLVTIQVGPFKKKIRIEEIESIRETKNPFSSPALSSDKLEINYARFETVAISPKDKTEFVRQLLVQNPAIIMKES